MPYNKANISIPSVSGNIVITVSTEAKIADYTNLADPSSADWVANARLNSGGTTTSASGQTTFNFIPCISGDVIRIKGINDGTLGRVALYNSSKGFETENMAKASQSDWTYSFANDVAIITITTTRTIAYFRYSGEMSIASSDVIITVNEQI